MDPLATIFYLVNSVQEWDAPTVDELDRFPFAESCQSAHGTLGVNVVQDVIDELCRSHPRLVGVEDRRRRSRVFLTHDVDSIHDAVRQDGLAALRRRDVGAMARLIWNAAVGSPDWLNMDMIMDIEDEHGFRSVFYWLVTEGRVNDRVTNSDYRIDDPKVRRTMARIAARGWGNGLHKSVSPATFADEIARLGFMPTGNRYHYLKFSLPGGYEELEEAGLELDCTLGFAEAPGFRNSYGLPFSPYSERLERPLRLVEAPMQFMDGSFQRYLGAGPDEAFRRIVSLVEQHPRECVFTVLWHNTFFADGKFRGFLDVYKRLLAFFRESDFACVTEDELVTEFSM